jgi:uncharacterized protein (UPF0305 family)
MNVECFIRGSVTYVKEKEKKKKFVSKFQNMFVSTM